MSAQITPQDIIDRREALTTQHSEAYRREQARIRAESNSLQELCGAAVGHVFVKGVWNSLVSGRQCAFCQASEPRRQGMSDE